MLPIMIPDRVLQNYAATTFRRWADIVVFARAGYARESGLDESSLDKPNDPYVGKLAEQFIANGGIFRIQAATTYGDAYVGSLYVESIKNPFPKPSLTPPIAPLAIAITIGNNIGAILEKIFLADACKADKIDIRARCKKIKDTLPQTTALTLFNFVMSRAGYLHPETRRLFAGLMADALGEPLPVAILKASSNAHIS